MSLNITALIFFKTMDQKCHDRFVGSLWLFVVGKAMDLTVRILGSWDSNFIWFFSVLCRKQERFLLLNLDMETYPILLNMWLNIWLNMLWFLCPDLVPWLASWWFAWLDKSYNGDLLELTSFDIRMQNYVMCKVSKLLVEDTHSIVISSTQI